MGDVCTLQFIRVPLGKKTGRGGEVEGEPAGTVCAESMPEFVSIGIRDDDDETKMEDE